MFRIFPLFWVLVALFFIFRPRRRWMRRWATTGPWSAAPYGPFEWGRNDPRYAQPPQMPAPPQPLAQPDRTLVETLESRIAELETRLEFAERLMATKNDNRAKQ